MSNDFSIRTATAADVDGITRCVNSAYQHYIERIGKPPGPMLENYRDVVETHQVFVAVNDSDVVGILVLIHLNDAMMLDNIAVHPSFQGQGLGRRLMALAEEEAKKQGFSDIQLYTHQMMTENIAMYSKLGYVEVARRSEKGYDRVYMSKHLW